MGKDEGNTQPKIESEDSKESDKQVLDYNEWFDGEEYLGYEEGLGPLGYAQINFHDIEVYLKREGWHLEKATKYKRHDTIRVGASRSSFLKEKVEHSYFGSAHLFYQKKDEKIVISLQLSQWGSTIEIFHNDDEEAEKIWKNFNEYHITEGVLKRAKFDMGFRFITPRGRNWSDLIMNDAKKDIFRTNVTNVIANHQQLITAGFKTSRGIILCGPPGVGKTLTCDALVNEIDETVIYVTNDNITDRGDIAKVFNFARKLSPTLVIFEDIDALGTEQRSLMGSSPMLAEFLNALDGIEENAGVVTIASTNHSDFLDWALLRPGRFEIRVDYDYPNNQFKADLFTMFLEGKANLAEINIRDLTNRCSEKMTGAHIREIVIHAGLIAGDESGMKDLEIKQKHIDEALSRTLITQSKFEKERGHLSQDAQTSQWG